MFYAKKYFTHLKANETAHFRNAPIHMQKKENVYNAFLTPKNSFFKNALYLAFIFYNLVVGEVFIFSPDLLWNFIELHLMH